MSMKYMNQFYSDIRWWKYLPELASPADIELLTVGESVSKSLSIDAAKLRGSSKFKSSNALPVTYKLMILLGTLSGGSDRNQHSPIFVHCLVYCNKLLSAADQYKIINN